MRVSHDLVSHPLSTLDALTSHGSGVTNHIVEYDVKVLITGSSGFVGRHLLSALRGHDVYPVDIANRLDAVRFFDTRIEHFDLVLHCAAFVNGRAGIDGSPAYLHAYNTQLDAALFSWALRNAPGRVVYFSSSAAYPAWDQYGDECELLNEDLIEIAEPSVPETSYGMSKLHGEQMAADVRDAGVPVTVLRPFSGYGADQSLHYPFPSFIQRAVQRTDPFEIWGSGQQVRDWLHIDDLVGGTLAAVAAGIDGPVNLCTGRGTTFDELATMVTRMAGYSPQLLHREDKAGGVDYRVGDPTRMHEFYVPQVKLEEGIGRALMSPELAGT